MDSSDSVLANRASIAGIKAAFIIAASALIFTACLIVNFYFETEAFPPGREIRPMGLAAFLGLTGACRFSAEAALPCMRSLPG
jgi:hypothetical protein